MELYLQLDQLYPKSATENSKSQRADKLIQAAMKDLVRSGRAILI